MGKEMMHGVSVTENFITVFDKAEVLKNFLESIGCKVESGTLGANGATAMVRIITWEPPPRPSEGTVKDVRWLISNLETQIGDIANVMPSMERDINHLKDKVGPYRAPPAFPDAPKEDNTSMTPAMLAFLNGIKKNCMHLMDGLSEDSKTCTDPDVGFGEALMKMTTQNKKHQTAVEHIIHSINLCIGERK